jgi:hypothetical protein
MSSVVDTLELVVNVIDLSYKTVGVITMILGSIGHLCSCFVFLCIPALKKHPNALFIVASAAGGLVYINIGLFPAVGEIYSGTNPITRSLFLCKTNYWLTYASGSFSFTCNCFASLGQFLITLPQIRWHRLITRVRAQLMILLTALVWLLIFLPLAIFYKLTPASSTTFTCSSTAMITAYGNCWEIVGFYFIPMIVTFIFFSLTWYNLARLRRRVRRLDAAVTRMMLIQMSILLVNGIPPSGFLIYLLATVYVVKPVIQSLYEFLVLFIVILTTFVTNGASFWVYLIASSAFRRHIKEFLLKYTKFRRRVAPFPIDVRTINTVK